MRGLLNIFFLLGLSHLAWAQITAVDIARKLDSSVVVVEAYTQLGNYIQQGSGVVLPNGMIVSNFHVFDGMKYMIVRQGNKRFFSRKIISYDKERDYIIFTIDDNPFLPVKIGNSNLLKKGEQIYAIGSPKGYENSITRGIVSALRAESINQGKVQNYIQHDAAISKGSSGGALVNDKGELVGINVSQDLEGQNLNFAIPINEIMAALQNAENKNYNAKLPVPEQRSLYKEIQNPYGSGNGFLSVFTTCENCQMSIYVDDKLIGKTKVYFVGQPVCGQKGTVNAELKAGQHKIYAKDGYGNIWKSNIEIEEGQCTLINFEYKTPMAFGD